MSLGSIGNNIGTFLANDLGAKQSSNCYVNSADWKRMCELLIEWTILKIECYFVEQMLALLSGYGKRERFDIRWGGFESCVRFRKTRTILYAKKIWINQSFSN